MKICNIFNFFFLSLFMSIFNPVILLSLNSFINKKINFTESTDTINNPGMGYTTTYWLKAERNKTKERNLIGSLVLMFIDIGDYSSEMNNEKIDYDLDSSFFETLKKNFEICRKNGATIALRFRYDANGTSNPEPKSFDQILKHISQIKNSGLIEEYKDILMFVESGFVGQWGEQHGGKYCSLENKTRLLDTLLDVIPDNIPVTVRTPNIIAKWLNISEDKLDTFISPKGSKASRIGLFNDGYMGSDSDLGTYRYRENSVNFFYNQMRYTYFGGEFSGNIDFAKKYETYKPENSIKEMYKTHLSYINSNIFGLYKDYIFEKKYDVENVDNSAYYGQTVFKFIRDHLGYRLVLRNIIIQKEVKQGENFELDFDIENTGFANPIRKMNSELILEKDGNYMRTELDTDATEFYSCTTKKIKLIIKIPGSMNIGLWNIYFKLYVGKTDLNTYYMRSVRFANNDIFESNLGANYLGSINIISNSDESILTDRTFYQVNSINNLIHKNEFKLYNINKIIKLNGFKSLYEWTEDLLLVEKDNKKLYVKNDDKFLYVMAQIKQNATSPAINIQIKNNNDNKNYWFYYCSNGAIYFSAGNYENWLYMHNDDIFEFKIPLGEVMNMYFGTKLNSIRVFIQDMSKDWINTGEIKSEKEYIINFNFNIFTAFRNVTLKKGENYILDLDISLNNCSFQWLLNGEIIDKANKNIYEINNADKKDIGAYSVIIRSQFGEKNLTIYNINLYEGNNTVIILVVVFSIIIIILIVIGILLFLKFRKRDNLKEQIEKIEQQKDSKLI